MKMTISSAMAFAHTGEGFDHSLVNLLSKVIIAMCKQAIELGKQALRLDAALLRSDPRAL